VPVKGEIGIQPIGIMGETGMRLTGIGQTGIELTGIELIGISKGITGTGIITIEVKFQISRCLFEI